MSQDIALTAPQLHMLLIAYQYIPGTQKNLPIEKVRELFTVTRNEDPYAIATQLIRKEVLSASGETYVINDLGKSRIKFALNFDANKYFKTLNRQNPNQLNKLYERITYYQKGNKGGGGRSDLPISKMGQARHDTKSDVARGSMLLENVPQESSGQAQSAPSAGISG
jgi:hypothetical protein